MIEVLTIIGVVVLLLAILLPSINSARERGRRAFCANNLRQWGTALHYYREGNHDFLPMEGTHLGGGIDDPGMWYNELPQYLHVPAYKDIEGMGVAIKAFPNFHVWICPSKNLTDAFKSSTGMNQFHYGMNLVLDGVGKAPNGSKDAPGYPDLEKPRESHLPARMFSKKPTTVFMFDIYPNLPRGSPRDVATKFHSDYANFLYLDGGVINAKTENLVTNDDFKGGAIIWSNPKLYWGYPPPFPR